MTGTIPRRARRGCVALALAAAVATSITPAGAAPEPACARSTTAVDRGTWTSVPVEGIEGAHSSWELATDALDPRFVAVADYAGVLVSRDGGCVWRRALLFDDFGAERFPPLPVDAEIARGPGGRSIHVLTLAAWSNRTLLWSSDDDGRTWAVAEPPSDAIGVSPDEVELSAGTSSRGRLYLHAQHRTTTGALLFTEDDGVTWRWPALSTFGGPEGVCLPSGTCTAPPLVEVDPAGDRDTLWALAASTTVGELRKAVTSRDGGTSWDEVETPALSGGADLLDVAPSGRKGSVVLLLGGIDGFALSRDGGETWEVGDLPTVSEEGRELIGSFDVADARSGRWFAALPGLGPSTTKVVLFDGRAWEEVAPDNAGAPAFVEIDGTRDSFWMLSSDGLLAGFRPRS